MAAKLIARAEPPRNLSPDVMAAACPSRKILGHVTSRWGLLILIALQREALRFSALRRQIGGVSERMLAQSLQTLEADGFVRRHAFDVMPPRVEYSLTPLGEEITKRAAGLAAWIEANLHRIPGAAPPKQQKRRSNAA